MPALRILHLIDTGGPGGAETVFAQVATGLPRLGHSSVAVVSRDAWLAAQLRAGALEPRILPAKGSLNLGYLQGLLRQVRQERPDVIVTHLLGPAVYGSLAGLLTRTPVIAVLHGQSDLGPSERFRAAKSALIRRGAFRAVFVSGQLRDALLPRLGLPLERTSVIHNGVNVEEIAAAAPAPLRDQCGFPADSLLVGAVGNVRRPKAYDVLLRAARRAIDTEPRLRFVIAGDPARPLFDELLTLRADLGLDRHVQFLGLRADVPSVLKALDVFVTSSTTEGFSLACCEAMAAGVPVVATRSGGPEQILDDGRCGLLAPTGDARELAEAITRAAVDKALKERFVGAARSRVKQLFSTDAMLTAYDALVRAAATRVEVGR